MLNVYDGIEGYPLRTARSMLQREIQLQKANDAGLHNVTAAELDDASELVSCKKCGELYDSHELVKGLCFQCFMSE